MPDHIHDFNIIVVGKSSIRFNDWIEWAFCIYCGFHLPWISDKASKWVM